MSDRGYFTSIRLDLPASNEGNLPGVSTSAEYDQLGVGRHDLLFEGGVDIPFVALHESPGVKTVRVFTKNVGVVGHCFDWRGEKTAFRDKGPVGECEVLEDDTV
jgi:hypothetical protein